MKNKLLVLLISLGLIVVLSACLADDGGDAEANKGSSSDGGIKVGLLYPLTGGLALLGNESVDGIELVANYVNENGGVNGEKINLVRADAPDATAAQNEITRLIDREKVPLVMGTYASGLSIAASQVAERNSVLYVETNAVADEITSRGFENVYRIGESASIQGHTSVDFVNDYLLDELGIAASDLNAVILHEDSSFGTAVADAVTQKAEEYGFNILSTDNYNSETNDLSPTIHKYKGLNPDVVFATSYINDSILFIQQSKQLDFEPKVIIGSSGGYALSDFGSSLGSDSTGIFVTDAPANTNDDALNDEAKELNELYSELWLEEYGTPLTGQTWRVINAAHVMFTEVLPNAEDYTSEGIKAALQNLDIELGSLPNGTGVKFGEIDDHPNQNSRANTVIMQWQDESLELVWPEDFANSEPKNVPFGFDQ